MGKGMREFKDAVSGKDEEQERAPSSLPRAPEDEENVALPPRERDIVP